MKLQASLGRIVPGDLSGNPTLLSLLTANLITIVLAVLENWDLATILFIYWAQSVIIGIFTFITLLTADTSALAADMGKAQAAAGGSPVAGERYVWFYKAILAGFFALHYGLFHWGYYSFIVESGMFGPLDFASAGIWASCGIFLANHLYSFLYHRNREPQGAMFFTRVFFEPYNRIIPMHMTIIFGSILVLALGFFGIPAMLPVLVLFLLLKTRMDIVQHLRKHPGHATPDVPEQFIGF
jgi:hypothetical protein